MVGDLGGQIYVIHCGDHTNHLYLIGPFSAGPFLMPAPLTPALIPPVLKMRLTPIRAGVKRTTNFLKSGIKRAAFFERPMRKKGRLFWKANVKKCTLKINCTPKLVISYEIQITYFIITPKIKGYGQNIQPPAYYTP